MQARNRRTAAALAGALFACACAATPMREIPHLRPQGDAVQLIVDGAPHLILGGELGNSSASDLESLRPSWPTFRALNLNTLLAPVSWELIEPQEARFDFSAVDGLIRDARRNDMRLVLLWFGSWKNSMSSYAPAWVKRDQARFPRAQRSDGAGMEMLSPFSDANRDADARAFAALMAHLRETDGAHRTVIMVQVENEVGMIPQARDHSALADARFAEQVPSELITYLSAHRASLEPSLRALWEARGARTSGDWRSVFGDGPQAEEVFTAWAFARYVERIAAAGKAAYPLPMFVNAALIRPGRAPGEYPSGGPLPHLADIWAAGAPSIDFLAPDIYFPNFAEWLARYDRPDAPVFIPEAGRAGAPDSAANALYAIGAHDAIGFSPFSIDSVSAAEAAPLGRAYALLMEIAPLILAHQGRGAMAGVRAPVAYDGTVDETPQRVALGDFWMTVSLIDPWIPRAQQHVAAHGGLIIALAPDEFLIAGAGMTLTFAPRGPGDPIAGIESAWEGRYVDGRWRPGRLLNGDQTHQGRHVRLPPGAFSVQRVRLYRYR